MNWIIAVILSLAVGFALADKSGSAAAVLGGALGGATVIFAVGAIGAQVVEWSYRLFRKPFSRAQFFSVYWVTWVLSVLGLMLGGGLIEGPATPFLGESESPATTAINDSEDIRADWLADWIESGFPLRYFRDAWSEAQVREWAGGPVKEWLDKTALLVSMLHPEDWHATDPRLTLGVRYNVRPFQNYIRLGQSYLDSLLIQPYSLKATKGILWALESIQYNIGEVTDSQYRVGPSSELLIELITHSGDGADLSVGAESHFDALLAWYENKVAPPQW